MLDVSVIIPVRNAEDFLDECLASVACADPREIIIVDGMSVDRTLEIAQLYPVTTLSDEGRGLPAARILGAEAAVSQRILLLDADVVLPEGALAALLEEFVEGGYTALQAGLHSVSGPGYWGQALAYHHRMGKSKDWFGLVSTIFEKEVLLTHGFDPRFLSGEDIELRWRLQRAGAKIGVSRRTVVTHRFGDSFGFARGQWKADGEGLARMVHKHGLRGTILLGLPFAAAVRGTVLSFARRQPVWIPYFLFYMVFNYKAMIGEMISESRRRTGAREAIEAS